MLAKQDIDRYLDSIPPIPKIVKTTLMHLENSDMIQAANTAKDDIVFLKYLSSIVNKPIFGFRDEIKNTKQIFGILGLDRAKQVVRSYYMQIIMPKSWEVFDFSNKKFQNLQANLMIEWSKILDSLSVEDENLEQSIVLVPASLIVCEMLFRDMKDTIIALKQTRDISYDTVLYKMTGYKLLDIVLIIAKKWEFSQSVATFLKETFLEDSQKELCKFLRLLLSYEMSKPYIIKSGLNDFFDFSLSFTQEDIEKFQNIINYGKST